jgi:hypothetical protein
MKTKTIVVVIIAALLVIAAVIVYSKAVRLVPQDSVDAKLMHFENTRAQRYTEIFAIYGNAITKNLTAGVYNTLGLNGASPTGAGDSTPQALLDKVTPDLVKSESSALGGFINGPRVWTLDWIEVNVGAERDFNGLKARWVTWFPIPKGMDLKKKGSTYYKPVQVERHTKFGFNKDKPVFILDTSDGETFVMKSLSLEQDKTQTYESLTSLGSRLKLPAGWKFRVPPWTMIWSSRLTTASRGSYRTIC